MCSSALPRRAPWVIAAALLVLVLPARRSCGTIAIETVPVGNAGNAGQVQSEGTFGAVGVDYRIGAFEVTNAQYSVFLNSVAAADPFELYNFSMGTSARGGIVQSGVSGGFTYAVKADMGNKPVNYVSWYDAARFSNWLHNNQPIGAQGAGTTETGAYTLQGGTTTPSNGLTVTRESAATWFLPSENEWYKAAYYNPMTSDYFTYPTSSNAAPAMAAAASDGDISNPGTNVANYNLGADWNGQDGNLTTVGSADNPNTLTLESASPYLTFDQGGNVQEWNETPVTALARGVRGGAWQFTADSMRGADQWSTAPTTEFSNMGFRVATIVSPTSVPEAGALSFGALVAAGALVARRFRG
jgi:sulfatase modifying factor 1